MKCRLKAGSNHFEKGKPVAPGTVLDLTPQQAHAWRDRFVPLDPPVRRKKEKEKPKIDPAAETFDLGDLSWEDAVKVISGIQNIDTVDTLLVAEKAGKGRKSVIEAAEKRFNELLESEEEGDDDEEEAS